MRKVQRSFYNRGTHEVAQELLGKLLVRDWRGKKYVSRIAEVESYVGENDKACHAARGKTKRNEVMFGRAGFAYVYLIYGMYHCLNIVTDQENFPAAVLVRGAVPVSGFDASAAQDPSFLSGPGKLTRETRITRAQNGEDLTVSDKLYVADDGFTVRKKEIKTGRRVGVNYAGADSLLPWRYYIENSNACV